MRSTTQPTLLKNNRAGKVCVALRLGTKILKERVCECGTRVMEESVHGLSCQRRKGRFDRQLELNDIIYRTLASAQIPCTLEPVGLCREDGKRPDSMSLVPWSKGQMFSLGRHLRTC